VSERSRLRVLYGIAPEEYALLYDVQEGRCAICGAVKLPSGSGLPGGGAQNVLVVDHDHATGAVRGLLCSACNVLLGHAKERVDVLESAAAYLRAADEVSLAKSMADPLDLQSRGTTFRGNAPAQLHHL
jgi:hypothetical protein